MKLVKHIKQVDLSPIGRKEMMLADGGYCDGRVHFGNLNNLNNPGQQMR
jgi:hypothetical protein